MRFNSMSSRLVGLFALFATAVLFSAPLCADAGILSAALRIGAPASPISFGGAVATSNGKIVAGSGSSSQGDVYVFDASTGDSRGDDNQPGRDLERLVRILGRMGG